MYTTPQAVEDYVYTEITNTFSIFSAVRNVNMSDVGATNVAFDYNNVIIADSFKGELEFSLEFDSPTTFNLYKSESGVSRNLFVSSGDITLDYSIAEMTILAGTIFGPLVSGDVITFLLRRDISVNNLISIIDDAEAEIDSFVLAERMVPWTDFIGPVFGTLPNVPKDIRLAATMWSVSFMIERRQLQQVAVQGERPFTEILKNSARKKLRQAGKRLGQMRPVVAETPLSTDGANLADGLTDLSEECGITTFEDCDGC